MKILTKVSAWAVALSALALTGCSSDGDGSSDSGSEATTYTLSGTMAQNASSSGFYGKPMLQQFKEVVGLSSNRTQCNDGQFYGIYCVSFSSPPVAAEGDVDCSGGGGFSVAGLPVGEAVGCFVRRYSSADSSATAATVGAIQIPAANLNGSTSQLVSSGDVALEVSISESGTINATVASGGDNLNTSPDSTIASDFTDANITGIWALACGSTRGGSALPSGRCKCFFGDTDSAYSGDEGACLADDGAAISGNPEIGVALHLYQATVGAGGIEVGNGQTVPEGSTINGISIWGTSGPAGSYVSLKTGGEGVTNLGGKLTWSTSTTHDPTAAVVWATSVDPDEAGVGSVAIPAVPSATANHAAWIAWAKTVTENVDDAGWTCPDAMGGDAEDHVFCVSQAMNIIEGRDDVTVPRVWVNPYCDQNGCDTDVNTDSHAFTAARIEIEGLHFDYEGQGNWTTSSDFSTLTPETDTIGIEPGSRYVFEPVEFFPGGAGFRQRHSDERHYECKSSGGDVTDAACSNGSYHYELVCHSTEELSISFFGTSSPMDALFDQTESVGYARLVQHGPGGESEIAPSSGTAVDLCIAKRGGGGGIFYATATKQ